MITKEQATENNFNIIDTDATLTDAKNARIEHIKAILPNVINSDNQLDIKALNDLLGAINTTSNNQGYELTFAGKGLARAKADTPTTKELKFELEQSKLKNFNDTDNVIIRGDNIDSLKILYKNYHNKIKMIYIDPPYNTKSENFVYNDNFKQSEFELIDNFGLNDDTCNFLQDVYKTRTHSGWLSFIYPRLMLAKELLTDDGVIFISIDDNEQANLKIICDEIFGEENFVANIIWNNKYTLQNDAKYLSGQHDNILFYSKNKNLLQIGKDARTDKQNDSYKNHDNDPKGAWKATPIHAKSGSLSSSYTIEFDNGIVWTPPAGRYPRYSKERLKELYNLNELYFNSNGGVDKKTYLSEVSKKGVVFSDMWFYQQAGHTHGNNEELASLVGKGIFDNPKGTILVKRIMNVADCKNSDTILDFFAGSGTTAHAVMQLNAEDGGNRKFILCQWDEPIDPKKSKPAYDFCIDNGFDPVISSITLERVKRAGDKIQTEHKDKKIDIGYKVFSLTEKPRVNYDAEMQPSFHIINTRGNPLDTLVNMLVATCQTLDTKIETIRENAIYKANNEIYVVNKITANELKNFKDLKINIDAFADINLTDYLNINLNFGKNMTVIF